MKAVGSFLVVAAALWACTVPADDDASVLPADQADASVGGVGGKGPAQGGHGGLLLADASGGAKPPLDAGAEDDAAATGGAVAGAGGLGGAMATGGMMTGGTMATGGMMTGGVMATGGMMATGGGGGQQDMYPPDTTRFNFEQSTQNWVDLGASRGTQAVGLAPARTTERSFGGMASLRYEINVPHGTRERLVGVVTKDRIGPLPVGATVTYQVWVPEGHKISDLQGFMQTTTSGSWVSEGRSGSQIGAGAWTQLSIRVPESYAGRDPLELGVRLLVNGPWSGVVYIDAVHVQ